MTSAERRASAAERPAPSAMLPGIWVAGGAEPGDERAALLVDRDLQRDVGRLRQGGGLQAVGQRGHLRRVTDVVVVVASRVVDDAAGLVLRDRLGRGVDAEQSLVGGLGRVAHGVGVATGHLDDEQLTDLLLQRHVPQQRDHLAAVRRVAGVSDHRPRPRVDRTPRPAPRTGR